MKRVFPLLIGAFLFVIKTIGQQVTLTPEQVKGYTPEWKGERFPDGRPKVDDRLLERLKAVAIEEAWGILRNKGYQNQYEGDWMVLHPDSVMTGRVVTAQYMPLRPDVDKIIKDIGKKEGRIGNTNSWPIDVLGNGDVYVAGFDNVNASKPIAKYWKNGVEVALSEEANAAQALGVAVVGGKVHVAGWENKGTGQVAMHWVDGVSTLLGTENILSTVAGIATQHNDIYIAGAEVESTKSVAKYWKNGTAISLSDGSRDEMATAITVSNGNTYVAGYEYGGGGKNVAKYWKNGTAVTLTDEDGAGVTASGLAVVRRK